MLHGIRIHWSYAPAEVKVLVSPDAGNFQEAFGWRRIARAEPSFEEDIMFAEVVSSKAVSILMRGPKPWGFFGISNVAAISAPYPFMLVSGKAAVEEQCVVAKVSGLELKPCLDAIVKGDGAEIFTLMQGGKLKLSSGQCLAIVGGRLSSEECPGQTMWTLTADGQLKHGSTCLSAATGSQMVAIDCDAASAGGADKFFEVAVPSNDAAATLAVRSVGSLLKAAAKRQNKVLDALRAALPKLDKCNVASLDVLGNHTLPAGLSLSRHRSRMYGGEDEAKHAVSRIAGYFGIGHGEFTQLVAASTEALTAVFAKLN